MSLLRSGMAIMIALVSAAGCRQAPPEKPMEITPPPSTVITEEVRADLQKRAPDAIIGRIIAALPEERLVAVGEVNVADFRRGEGVTLYGTEDVTLGHGEVVEILADAVHVRYPPPPQVKRAPTVGDLVVKFKEK